MSLKHSFQRVLGTGLDGYNAPKRWTIEGVDILFKPGEGDVTAADWREVLEEWLPKYAEVGWLDELHRIFIGDGIVRGNSIGQYHHSGSIDLEKNITGGHFTGLVQDDTREAVLTHEMIHHAHLTLNDYDLCNVKSPKEDEIREEVSHYAGKNIGESVAEIGTGIVHGEQFPAWVHKYYASQDGPEGVYDIWLNDTKN